MNSIYNYGWLYIVDNELREIWSWKAVGYGKMKIYKEAGFSTIGKMLTT